MASYTENYALTKPTMAESADIRVINSNMDTVDDVMHSTQISLAPAYDMTETYNTGDVVMYELLMYECLEDEVTGAWDATKWQRTTAGEHGGGSDVEVTQIQTEGKAVASIAVDGVSTDILVPDLKVYGEASGDLITIEDAMEAPLEECKVTLEPQQAGTGDPSPSNVRPISGWDEVKVNRTGVNIWDEEWESGSYRSADGTPSIDASRIRSKNKIEVISDNMYLVTLASTLLFFYDANDEYLGYKSQSTSGVITPITWYPDAKYIRFSVGSSSNPVTDYTSGIAINYPSTDTSYHAYNGQTYTIQLGSTCYGGELDVKNGELQITYAKIALADISKTKYGTYQYGVRAITGFFDSIPNSSMLTGLSNTFVLSDSSEAFNVDKNSLMFASGINKTSFLISTQASGLSADSSVTEINEWLRSIDAYIVYPLATPQEIQLTPTEVTLLRGINNLWSDGEIYVKYRRDIEMLLQRIADSLGGN